MKTVQISNLKKFNCLSCGKIFTAEGEEKEYTSAVYGPCVSFRATCPDCGSESPEFIDRNGRKSENENGNGCCGGGGCACRN